MGKTSVRKSEFTRLLPATSRMIDVIGAEMAEKNGVPQGEAPFYKHDGSVNRSEVIRRLLAKADRRLREP